MLHLVLDWIIAPAIARVGPRSPRQELNRIDTQLILQIVKTVLDGFYGRLAAAVLLGEVINVELIND